MATYEYKGQSMVAPFTFRSNQDIWTVEKRDKSVDRGKASGQRWEIDFGVVNNDNMVDLFLANVTGFDSEEQIIMPQMLEVETRMSAASDKANNSSRQLSLSVAGSIGDSNVTVSCANDVACFIPKGYFFKFQNHKKLYVTTADCSVAAGVGQTATLSFFPPLIEDVVIGNNVKVTTNALINVYQDDTNLQGITYKDGVLMGINRITLIESP